MIRNVYIYCEGQTEEAFVNEILAPYLRQLKIYAWPIIAATKRSSRKKYRGGIMRYDRIRHELRMLCKGHKNELVTTMIDYYGLPKDAPGLDKSTGNTQQAIIEVEDAIGGDINEPNLLPYLQRHEFEALLFTDPHAFGIITDDSIALERIAQVRKEFATPEDINNSFETAPSKRITQIIPTYKKIIDGIAVAEMVGIDAMIHECPHFSSWISRIRASFEEEKN
ncbi:MAG: DUF4276 family protein [Atopobiaceae bacterium]|nr:DUF4276 family protein [Atopobiaceae bacterium]